MRVRAEASPFLRAFLRILVVAFLTLEIPFGLKVVVTVGAVRSDLQLHDPLPKTVVVLHM